MKFYKLNNVAFFEVHPLCSTTRFLPPFAVSLVASRNFGMSQEDAAAVWAKISRLDFHNKFFKESDIRKDSCGSG